MVVELNSAGFRKPIKEQYPSLLLLESIVELGIDITFSSDAHSVEQIGLNGEKLISIMHNFGYEKCAIFKNREKEMIKF